MSEWAPDFRAEIARGFAEYFDGSDSGSDEDNICASCGSTVREGVCVECGAIYGLTEVEDDVPEVARRSRQSGAPQRSVESLLRDCNELHKRDNPMPMSVLDAVAKRYMEISEILSKGFGTTGAKKEVVRRGNRRREVIAALIHFELIRAGIAKKRESIAAFMNLQTAGFSRGEGIVRRLSAMGVFEIPSDDGLASAYVRKYFGALNIVDDNSASFVVALVEATDKRFACASSCLASKVVGAIWIAIRKQGYTNVSAGNIEAVDSIKKSTFMKYSKYVDANIEKYRGVFEAYRIPTDGDID